MTRLPAVTLAALLSLSPSAAFAQAPPRLTESIEIDLVNVDVAVTDRKGNRVHGLTRDDFRVFDDGKLQEITNFAEYRETRATAGGQAATYEHLPATRPEAAAKRVPLRLVVFIDDSSLHLASRSRAIGELQRFLHRSMVPGDEVSIVSWGRTLKTLLPFEGDLARIDAALAASSSQLASGGERESQAREVRERDSFRTRADSTGKGVRSAAGRATDSDQDRAFSAEERYKMLRRTADAVKAVMTKVSGLEGKKAFVVITEGFESNALGLSASGPPNHLYDTTPFMQSIVDAANMRGITLYTIHAQGLELPGGNVESQEMSEELPEAAKNAALMNSTLSLGLMSRSSGGLLSMVPTEMAKFFENVATDLSSYYSLAYVNRSGKVDAKRKLRIETVNRDYVVRARDSAVTRSEETKLKDQLTAALFYDAEANGMKVALVAGVPKRSGRKEYLVPLEVRFPMDAMTFLPQGGEYKGGFSVYITSSDNAEDSTKIDEKSQRVVIPAAKYDAALKQLCVYGVQLKTRGVGGVVAVAVRDEISGTTSIRKMTLPVCQAGNCT